MIRIIRIILVLLLVLFAFNSFSYSQAKDESFKNSFAFKAGGYSYGSSDFTKFWVIDVGD